MYLFGDSGLWKIFIWMYALRNVYGYIAIKMDVTTVNTVSRILNILTRPSTLVILLFLNL